MILPIPIHYVFHVIAPREVALLFSLAFEAGVQSG